MTHRLSRILSSLLFSIAVLHPSGLFGDAYGDWLKTWEEVLARENLSQTEQLEEQTQLLTKAFESDLPLNGELWSHLTGLLEQWENSAEIEKAREAYVSLLRAVCEKAEGQDDPVPDEAALRSYLKRALSLVESGTDEGEFLLFVAESWIRSTSVSTALLRRAESLLQQAITLLGNEQPLDIAHFRLGQLYQLLGERENAESVLRKNPVFLTRSVYHYELVSAMAFARPHLKASAAEALTGLLQPELELNLDQRYLPNDAIRLAIRSRNLDSVTVSVISLPPEEQGSPRTLAELREVLFAASPDPTRILSEKTFSTRGRYPHDWRNRQIRLDANLVGGWYGLHVEGEGLVLNELLLVSPIEAAAFPRQDGSLLVWVSDGETGQPVPGASVTVLAPDGSTLAEATSDMEGLVEMDSESLTDWQEVYIVAGPNPGHLRRVDIPEPEAPMPWIVTNPLEIQPGGTLNWALLGMNLSGSNDSGAGPVFHLPDGSELQPEATDTGPDWISGILLIPSGLTENGPIYADLSPETRIHVGHVRINRTGVLDLQISGEQLSGTANLFHASSPLGVSISSLFGSQAQLPDFIRLRVSRVQRDPVIDPLDLLQPLPELLYESILPFDTESQKETFLELPDLFSGEVIQPLRIEVQPLDSEEALSEVTIGLVPYRRMVELSLQEHIVEAGSSPVLSIDIKNPDAADERPIDGDLVVFRETWQNRYIHRRRGTPLSEAEYQALPDRSLLGAAKTDYRLVEEGFIREEMRRVPVEIAERKSSVSVQLDQPGYYIIEFVGREVDTAASYPDGPLELWVLPDSNDLRAFRSDEPRLITESDASGQLQVLMLLDRTDCAVLVDLERGDGTTFTEVAKPEDTALYFEIEQPAGSGLVAVRALIVGNRQTKFLSGTAVRSPSEEWVLTAENLFGLNPGVEFEWEVLAEGSPGKGPALWTFFEDDSESLSPGRLRWQSEQQSTSNHHPQTLATYSSRWLPFANPFARESTPPASKNSPSTDSSANTELFLSVYPEVNRFSREIPDLKPFNPIESPGETGPFDISGTFPSSAGRWKLTLLSAIGHHNLKAQSWLISTELPIRSSIFGPEILRLGDRASLPFRLQNTTENSVLLELEPLTSSILQSAPLEVPRIQLGPGRSERLQLQVLAVGTGVEGFDVRVDGPNLSSEAVHTVEVTSPPKRDLVKFRIFPPDGTVRDDFFDLQGWTDAELLIAPSTGGLLPAIWPAIRKVQDPADALMAELCQWALGQVLRHHGESATGVIPDNGEEMFRLLEQGQLDSGGWGWSPSGNADPWLSAFVVWSLELFSPADEAAFGSILDRGQQYLETVLVDETVDVESRLFALRALAMPAFHSGDVRPSRIQARTFLDFLHQQLNLPDGQVAILLQVAKAYDFRQEVALLSTELQNRQTENLGFWPASLVYLALDDIGSNAAGVSRQRLQQALRALQKKGPSSSWEQLAGFLNLLAAYYWKGDFFADGEVSVSIPDGFQGRLPLNADFEGDSMLRIPLQPRTLKDGRLGFRMDMQSALSPVFAAAIGSSGDKEVVPAKDGVSVQFQRQFFESTLLQGTRNRSLDLGPELSGIHAGDTLRVLLTIDLAEPRELVRLQIPVPAGMRLSPESISHAWEPAADELVTDVSIEKLLRESRDTLTQTMSIGPLPVGRHLFTLSYEALWAGTYYWPECRMLNPRTGEVHQLIKSRKIEILPEGL